MAIDRKAIEKKLKTVGIPQGQCGKKAFEIAELLLEQASTWQSGRYSSLDRAIEAIGDAVSKGGMAILWIDTGPICSCNPNYRAIHCCFVVQSEPLESFSVWQEPGVVFYNEEKTRSMISETLSYTQDSGGIEIHGRTN